MNHLEDPTVVAVTVMAGPNAQVNYLSHPTGHLVVEDIDGGTRLTLAFPAGPGGRDFADRLLAAVIRARTALKETAS